MPLKIFRALWFLSVIVLFATLLYGYAGWQENMVIQQEASENVALSRDVLFYTLVGIFILTNVLVYIVSAVFRANEDLRTWFHGLMITINIFFVIAMNFIGLYNSAERFDYPRIGFVVYGSIALIVVWAAAWPIYSLYQKFLVKPTV